MQVIGSAFEVAIADVRLEHLSASNWPAEVSQRASADARLPFDLGRGPLLRLHLLHGPAQEHALFVTVHHLVADRWSLGQLSREISTLYAALTSGAPANLAPVTGQYADITVALQNERDDTAAKMHLEYWRSRLSGVAPLLLPTDRRPALAPGYRGGRRPFALGRELSQQLASAATRAGVTLYEFLLAAFAALLHRHTGQEDLVLCLPASGRHRAASKGVVGYFNQILPVRLDLSGDPDGRELLGRVRQAAQEAYRHLDVPLQRIAELPELAHTSLARCLFSLQNTPALTLELPGITARYEDVPSEAANFDLAVFLEEKDGELLGLADYKADLFSDAAADQLVQRLQDLLVRLARRLDQRLSELPAVRWVVPPAAKAVPAGLGLPRTELERRLILLWEEVLNVRPITPISNFFDLGGHSLLAARLFERLEKSFGQELPLAALLHAPTIEGMARLLTEGGWPAFWSSLVPIRPQGRRPPLFCVHGGGGGMLSAYRMAQYLDPEQPLWGLQARGLSRAQEPLTRVEDMARHYLEAVRSVQHEGPYCLGGYSLGALVAFEMAQQLRAQGQEVALLAIIDYPGPAAQPRWADKLRWHGACLSQLGWRDRFQYVANQLSWKLRSFRGLPEPLRLLIMRLCHERSSKPNASSMRLRQIEAGLTARDGYQIRPYDGRVSVFRCHLGLAQMHADACAGWGGTAWGGVEVHEIPGQHVKIFDEPNVQVFAAKLQAALNTALPG
jgi:thioesterase domain-containing protein